MRDIHQQILFQECLDDPRAQDLDDFQRRGCNVGLGDEDPCVEIVLRDVVPEVAHLFDADGGVGGEFDPDGADFGFRGWVPRGGEGGVFGEHFGGGARGEGHFLAARGRGCQWTVTGGGLRREQDDELWSS